MVVVFLTESADWTQVAVVEIVRHALQLVMPSATAQQVSNASTIVSMILYHCSCVIMLDFQIRCKDTSKLNNVFLCRWKFYQKIVSFSSFGFLIIPSKAMPYALYGYAFLLCHYFF